MHKFHVVIVNHMVQFVRAFEILGRDDVDARAHVALNDDEQIWTILRM